MNPAELRDHCLSFAGAEETFPFGPRTSVFKVAGRMFALSQLGADSLRVSLKCGPELAEALRGLARGAGHRVLGHRGPYALRVPARDDR
jgi:predicted DNA-binding protein (MmcQ/YjbR family)